MLGDLRASLAASAVADGYGYYPPLDLADNSFFGSNHGIAVNAEFLKTHRDFVQEAVNSVVKTTTLYARDHQQWIKDMTETGEFKANAIPIGVDHLVLDNKLYLARLDQLAAAMKDAGFVKAKPASEKLEKYYVYDSLRLFPVCSGARSIGSNAQPVDENVDEAQNAALPARLIVHVAHPHKGTQEVLGGDVVADFARRDRAVQQPTDGLRQPIERI